MKRNVLTAALAKKLVYRVFYLATIYIIIIGLSFMIIYPYLTKIVSSFMSISDLTDPTVWYIPKGIDLYFWRRAIDTMKLSTSFANTFGLAFAAMVLQIFTSSFVGYGFARFKFRGANLLFFLVIFTMLIPYTTVLLPYFIRFRFFNLIFTEVNLLNTAWPIIILSLTGLGLKNGLFIYIMRQFFRGMPIELEEAAYIDGCGYFKTFFYIIVPNSVPSMLTVALFAFSWQWTDISFTPILYPAFQTLAYTITAAIGAIETDPIAVSSMQNIGVLIIIVPLVVLFLGAQKYFIQGIERSGITS